MAGPLKSAVKSAAVGSAAEKKRRKPGLLGILEEEGLQDVLESVGDPRAAIAGRGKFDTELSDAEESQFQEWVAKRSKAEGRDVSRDLEDYDLRGAWKSGAASDDNGHLPDTFKKPNHPTFSEESKYSTPDDPGGRWSADKAGKYVFTPSKRNIRNLGESGLVEYFRKYEPDAKLSIEDKRDSVDRRLGDLLKKQSERVDNKGLLGVIKREGLLEQKAEPKAVPEEGDTVTEQLRQVLKRTQDRARLVDDLVSPKLQHELRREQTERDRQVDELSSPKQRHTREREAPGSASGGSGIRAILSMLPAAVMGALPAKKAKEPKAPQSPPLMSASTGDKDTDVFYVTPRQENDPVGLPLPEINPTSLEPRPPGIPAAAEYVKSDPATGRPAFRVAPDDTRTPIAPPVTGSPAADPGGEPGFLPQPASDSPAGESLLPVPDPRIPGFAEGVAKVAGLAAYAIPGLPQFIDSPVGQAIGNAALGNVIDRRQPEIQLGDPLDDGPPVPPAKPPPEPPVQEPPPDAMAQLMASGAGQVNTGGYTPAQVNPELIKRQAEGIEAATAALDTAQRAQATAAEQNATLINEATTMMGVAERHRQENEALAAEATARSVEAAQKHQIAHQSLMDEYRRASEVEVDPSRFWSQRNGLQKVSAVIAGALFGFAGKGMEWLNRLDRLVQDDVDLQLKEKANRMGGIKAQADAKRVAVDDALKLGATEASARHMAAAAQMEHIKYLAQNLALNTNRNDLKANAEGVIAALTQKQMELQALGLRSEEGRVAAINQDKARSAQLRQSREIHNAQLRVQMAKVQAKGKEPMPATLKKDVGHDAAELIAIEKMVGLLPEPGVGSQVWDAVKGLVPGSDAQARRKAFSDQSVYRATEQFKGVVNPHEEEMSKRGGLPIGEAPALTMNQHAILLSRAETKAAELRAKLEIYSDPQAEAALRHAEAIIAHLRRGGTNAPKPAEAPSYAKEVK